MFTPALVIVPSENRSSKAEFQSRVVLVRERMTSKEQEILGQWMTEEKMEKSGEFSKYL